MKFRSILLSFIFIFALSSISFSQVERQKMFNDLASSPEWQPDKVIQILAIEEGWHIGDLGAGGGYYTYRFAEETGPSGKVFAADINEEFLEEIEKTAGDKGYENVHIIKANSDDSRFQDASLDLLFTRNTFHHIENKNQYMKQLVHKLKPEGKIVLIDYKKEFAAGPPGHNVTREEILTSIEDTGLEIEKEYDFLEKQYFFVFKK
jgi:ubiquinone/menaquinone biosynthesis C-methylase UbiE